MNLIYTINGAGIDGTFKTLDGALDAWKAAGCPTQPGSSVWVTKSSLEKNLATTVCTFDLKRTAGGGLMKIEYVIGDATRPIGDGPKIIVHICNDVGAWGAGFVMAVSNRWPEPERLYRKWHKNGVMFELGAVQFVQVENHLWVANLIGQRGLGEFPSKQAPIRYPAVSEGLQRVATKAKMMGASVHMPRIGCGLAGGLWRVVGNLVQRDLADLGVPVFVYDLKERISPEA